MVWAGVEREMSVGAPSAAAVGKLTAGVARCVPHLRGFVSAGLFTPFGRCYADAGNHPEFSSIESDHPDEILRSLLFGDLLLKTAAGTEGIEIYRTNVDYCGATWGTHLNFACKSNIETMHAQLIPFLVSQVLLGAGGLVPDYSGIVFSLSPRSSSFIVKPIAAASNNERGLCHRRDEPLAQQYWRAHIPSAETTLTHWSTWLRIASAMLVVGAIEDGARPADSVRLLNPIEALQLFASDPTCRATVPTQDGRNLTAIDIQNVYLSAVRGRMGGPHSPDWAQLACDRWAATLEVLQGDPMSITCIDWCIKLRLFTDWIRQQHGIDWDDVGRLNRKMIWGGTLPGAREWPEVRKIRDELIEIDARFSSLNPIGLFDQLDAIGTFQHQIPGVSGTVGLSAMPTRGRAAVRAREIVRLAGCRNARCEWDEVIDGKGQLMFLPDPDTESGEWRPEKPFWALRRLRLM